MPGFVIEYNRRTGDRLVTEFRGRDGHRRALIRRLELEKQRPTAEWEIVSLNSDSIDTVMKTHSRYFKGDVVDKMSA